MSETKLEMLKGEGAVRKTTHARMRVECEECGEPAHYKHSFLFEGMRSNPASSAYRKDDCSWCSDADVFTCKGCRPSVPNGCVNSPSRYEIGERFAHMFLEWVLLDETIEEAE